MVTVPVLRNLVDGRVRMGRDTPRSGRVSTKAVLPALSPQVPLSHATLMDASTRTAHRPARCLMTTGINARKCVGEVPGGPDWPPRHRLERRAGLNWASEALGAHTRRSKLCSADRKPTVRSGCAAGQKKCAEGVGAPRRPEDLTQAVVLGVGHLLLLHPRNRTRLHHGSRPPLATAARDLGRSAARPVARLRQLCSGP
jgi:hypothetical protein